MNDTEIVCLIDSALMFTKWQTPQELKQETGLPIPTIRKELKRLLERGDVLKRGDKYKYDCA